MIFPEIGKELASWPFCARFSGKARREIRNRDDYGPKRRELHPSATRPRFALVRQDHPNEPVGEDGDGERPIPLKKERSSSEGPVAH